MDRGSELLAVTRFCTTRKIYESMVKITEIDVALRADIENERFEDGLCFIERKGDTPTIAKIVPLNDTYSFDAEMGREKSNGN